nr:hypothetical protein CFP56_34940 [Quercus suber]
MLETLRALHYNVGGERSIQCGMLNDKAQSKFANTRRGQVISILKFRKCYGTFWTPRPMARNHTATPIATVAMPTLSQENKVAEIDEAKAEMLMATLSPILSEPERRRMGVDPMIESSYRSSPVTSPSGAAPKAARYHNSAIADVLKAGVEPYLDESCHSPLETPKCKGAVWRCSKYSLCNRSGTSVIGADQCEKRFGQGESWATITPVGNSDSRGASGGVNGAYHVCRARGAWLIPMILVTPLEPVAPMVLDMPIEAGMLVMVLLAVLRETRLMKYVPANMLLHRGEPIGLCSLMRLLCLARWNLLYFSSIYLLCPYYSGPGTSSSCLLEKPETSTRFDATGIHLFISRETRLMKYVPANMLLHRGEPIGLCSLMRLLCLARWNLLYFSSIYLLCPYYSGPGTSSSCLLEKPETSTRFDATGFISTLNNSFHQGLHHQGSV